MRHLLCSTACLGFVAFAPAVMAQGAADSGWTYQMQLYLWGTEVGGEALGNDFELGFDTLLENLNFALMGGLKAYNGDWMGYGELSYADVGFEKGATVNVGGVADVDVDLDSDVQTTIVSFGGGIIDYSFGFGLSFCKAASTAFLRAGRLSPVLAYSTRPVFPTTHIAGIPLTLYLLAMGLPLAPIS